MGLLYVALVFALGFVLGALRVLVLEPRLGPLAAVAAELPLILAAAWWLCGRLLRRLGPFDGARALIAGGVALVVLLALEWALGVLLLGRTWSEHLAGYTTAAGVLGLLGQTLFAAFPLLHPARRGGERVRPNSPS